VGFSANAIDTKRYQVIGHAQEEVQHAIGVRLHDAIRGCASHDG
jgi:hypothetical protein